jgi:hypothetical protein
MTDRYKEIETKRRRHNNTQSRTFSLVITECQEHCIMLDAAISTERQFSKTTFLPLHYKFADAI